MTASSPSPPTDPQEDAPMRPTPTSTLVKSGLAKAPKAAPNPPRGSRRGRWSPPTPQG